MSAVSYKKKDWIDLYSGYIILAGIIAAISGFGLSRILDGWSVSSVAPTGIGSAIIIGFSILKAMRNKWFSTEASKRKALVGTNVAVMSIFAASIFAIVGFLNHRHYVRFDLTLTGKYTLSQKTKNILKHLDKPVVITTLFNQGEMFFEQIVDILKEYAHNNTEKIKIENIDPLRSRSKVEELAMRLKISDLQLNSVVFECGEYSKHVQQSDVMERQYPFKFKGEEAFTGAILNVTQEKQTTIYFVQGHGERQFDDYDRVGISGIANALKRDNCRIAPLNIMDKKKIPDDCDVLIVAGPSKAYLTEELNIIRNYLENRGNLLLMLEPAVPPNITTGFRTLLGEYGMVVRDDIVIYNTVKMPLFGIQTVAEIYVKNEEYGDHRITNDLKNYNTILYGACSIDAAPLNDQMPYEAKVLMYAPDSAWGETDIADLKYKKPEKNMETDVLSPISLAAASQVKELPKSVTQAHPAMANDPNAKPTGARLVVFGDVDFATNEFGDNPGNHDLVRNSINWLAKKETQLGISAKDADFRKAVIHPKQMKVIFWGSIAGIPVIPIIIGGIVWWKRRR